MKWWQRLKFTGNPLMGIRRCGCVSGCIDCAADTLLASECGGGRYAHGSIVSKRWTVSGDRLGCSFPTGK